MSYIGLCILKVLQNNNGGLENLDWVVLMIRGLIWISLAFSLHVQRTKCLRIFSLVWWGCFFSLVSGLNVEILIRREGFEVIDMVQWFVSLLLFFCGLRNLARFKSHACSDHRTSLHEPLLLEKSQEKASFFSRLTFSWVNTLLKLGYSKPLNLGDIPPLVADDEANLAYEKFAKSWDVVMQDGKDSSKNSVVRAISRVYLKETMLTAFYALVRAVSVTLSPLLLYGFVKFSNRREEEGDVYKGLVLVGCLILTKTIDSIAQRHWFFDARRSGMRIRSGLMVAIYKKQLRLSSLGRKRHSTGEIVNYIAVDAYRLGEFLWWFHLMWSQILQLFLSVGLLFALIGVGALPGLVPLVICGMLNVPFAKILQRCQSHFMTAQDERLRLTSEVLNNIKIIKLQSWEDKFKAVIDALRAKEFEWLAESQYKKVYGTVMYWMSPTVISSIVFIGIACFNSEAMNASTIFTVLATLRCMSEPVRMIPEALSVMIQVKVSFERINAFLIEDELKCSETSTSKMDGTDKSVAMTIRSCDFKWDVESLAPTLRDVNLEVKCGQKIAVCGPVGSGKSSLLYAILGEIPKSSGHVRVNGSTAYVAQTSWIQSGTIRENILFGKPMEKNRYEKAIKACALDKDINSFGYGDLTEIGQRGINMSGGQKQRIQLARAVYNDADIYLLDDPFSAVDAHTASTLFNDCVMSALAEKTVILVTHQVEFLSSVDTILVMDGGKVTQSGTYNELLMKGTAFEHLVNAHKNSVSSLTTSIDQNTPTDHYSDQPDEISSNSVVLERVQLTDNEEVETGDVGWKPFWDYIIVSKGTSFLCLGIVSQSCFIAFQAMATYWMALAIPVPSISNAVLIGVYTGTSSLSTVFAYLRSLFAAYLGLNASKYFFSGFTDAIFKAPMLFFDSTPVGRIFIRASSDLSVVDLDIPFSIIFVVAAGLELIATIIIMASVTWQVLVVAAFAIGAAAYFQGYYQASARELIRINGTTKAPVMNCAAETSLGVVTIRAFNKADEFFRKYLELIDTDARLFFYSNAAVEWLVLRIEAFQNLTLFTSTLLLVLLPKGYVSPGLVGLSLSYALALTGTTVYLARWYCNLSNYLISVERIKQFMNIPAEPPAIVEDMRPPVSWPSKGRVVLQDLKIKYRPNAPLVLKGITCTFEEGTRVGVVGRTGSGKTTLISALFRLVEPTSGKILIDELDICSMGLKDLRTKLSIIPQEPTLFKGSVRTNMDPLGLYSDTDIWQALDKCQLKATISALPRLLDSSVSDDGENWSVGQRQLFCLGRVLLKRNKILVLDEATASIDSSTDAILQKVIRQEFSDCTVITVAHRVPTVIDSDMVMVLSYGKLLEYDEPSTLMESNSSFSRLVNEYWSSCRKNSQQNLND